MARTEVEIEGLGKLLENLQALPKELTGKSGGPASLAMRKGANVIRDEAISRAPVASGKLRDSIVTKRDPNPRKGGATERYFVGIKGGAKRKYANTKRNRGRQRVGKTYKVEGNAYYWRFLEFGTEKMKPRPFLRPAFEARAGEALNTIIDELGKGIDRITKKMRPR